MLFDQLHNRGHASAMDGGTGTRWTVCNARTGLEQNKYRGGSIPGSAENGGGCGRRYSRPAASLCRFKDCLPARQPVLSCLPACLPHPYSCHALSLYGSLRRLLPPRLSGGLSRGGVEPGARRWPARAVGLGLGLGLPLGLGLGSR